MIGDDEMSIVPLDADRPVCGQGNNVAPSRSTIKIDSLCIKLGIVKKKGDTPKCRHFSIRGYVAGMRERGSSTLLSFSEQLPPMDIPNFRYWLCQRCLQNDGTENASDETPLPSVCGKCLVKPSARSCPPQNFNGTLVLPSGEGTSDLKPDGSKNDDDEIILAALGADKSQSYQEIPAKVKVSEEQTKLCIIDTNAGAPESNELKDHEDPQNTNVVKETIASLVSQPIQPGQHNDCQNGNPRRKARKVRLLKELLCGNTGNQQQKKETSSPLAASSQIKRKMVHDHDHDNDRDQRPVDSKKAKAFKGNAIAKNSVVEHSRPPEASEGGETINKYQWNKHGTQRSYVHSKVGGDAMTAWRSIFSDMGRTDNQVTNTYSMSKGRGTEPYSNFISPLKSDKKAVGSKKLSSNPLKTKIFAEDSRRMKDHQSGTELGLGLSLNYDPQALVQSQPSILNRPPSQDYSGKFGFFLGESSNIIAHRIPSADSKSKEESLHDVSNRHAPRTEVLQEKRPYTQLPYGNCSGHQKLDFSDPHKRNLGVKGYSEITRPHNYQRQEKMFTIGRSDEREIIELMAKNQYERNLCEARSQFALGGSNTNGVIHNTTVFHNKVNTYEGMPSSNPEYLNMIRPSPFSTSENMRPTTMRNPAAAFFHQDQVSSFTMFDPLTQSLKQPSKGIWISDTGPQRYYDSRYHHVSKGNNRIPQTHIYNPTNMQVLEAYNNKYHNSAQQKDVFSIPRPFGETYAKYSEKDKGKSMMDLDLNVVAPNVVEEQNNLESLNLNPKHISCLDSSYSNEAIPAMQLLSLMDAGKPSQSFSVNSQKFITKPPSPCYSRCSSTLTEKTNPVVNPHFPYSGLRPGLQNPAGSSFSSVFWTGQNVKVTSSHGQQVYHKPQEEKSRGKSLVSVSHGCRQEDSSYVFPPPWHANEDGSKLANRASGPRYDSSLSSDICTMNLNPADFSTPGPENVYMIGVEDLIFNGEICYHKVNSASENAYGPKKQKKIMKPAS